ncbi:MAG: hypothetical protein V1726_05310 [Methanobacteriota archaeon]
MEFQVPNDIKKLKENLKKGTLTVYGISSVFCGILALSFIWISPFFSMFLPLPEGVSMYHTPSLGFVAIVRYLTPNFAAASLALVFGMLAYWRKKPRDHYGKIGFILGLFVIILGIFQYIIASSVS